MYANTIVSKNVTRISLFISVHVFGRVILDSSFVYVVCSSSDVQIGDVVTIGECRPLSKTVRFNVLKVTKAAGSKKQFQKF